MREVAGSSVPAVSIPLAPIVAQRSALSVAVATFLLFAFTFSFSALACRSVLLPEPFRSIFVDFPFSSFAGGISSTMPFGSAAIAGHLPRAGLGVPIHDGEARVPFLSSLLVHLITPSFSKPIGSDELETKFGIVGQVINSVVRSSIVLTVSDSF